jgi:hypothetical protein
MKTVKSCIRLIVAGIVPLAIVFSPTLISQGCGVPVPRQIDVRP